MVPWTPSIMDLSISQRPWWSCSSPQGCPATCAPQTSGALPGATQDRATSRVGTRLRHVQFKVRRSVLFWNVYVTLLHCYTHIYVHDLNHIYSYMCNIYIYTILHNIVPPLRTTNKYINMNTKEEGSFQTGCELQAAELRQCMQQASWT